MVEIIDDMEMNASEREAMMLDSAPEDDYV